MPEEDKHTVTKDYLETQLAILMGGRCAEEIFMNRKTTGAGNDIERSTDLARKMVCEYGMSKMGPLTFGKKEEQIFLGREISQHRDFSEETARQIDAEVRCLVDEAYRSAYDILDKNHDIMHRMASALLERETLDAAEIRMIIDGKELPPLKLPGGPGSPHWRCPAGAPPRRRPRLRIPGRQPVTGVIAIGSEHKGQLTWLPFAWSSRRYGNILAKSRLPWITRTISTLNVRSA